MVRSMPYQNFFWEPTGSVKEYEFVILTWGHSDKAAKRWDRGEIVACYLAEKGMKGLIISQRDKTEKYINRKTKKYVDSGNLVFDDNSYDFIDFHNLICKAKFAIFPNTIDAFPKFAMECLLADLPIYISEDLLMGKEIIRELGSNVSFVIDYNDKNIADNIYKEIINYSFVRSPREVWLEKYNFNLLSKQWADEFNRLFGSNYKRLFFMNHINRIKEHNILTENM
jgi:hypothetical protein